MSLYHTAATILSPTSSSSTSTTTGGSLKSRIYSSIPRSAPQIYALISEVSKWDTLLKEVIEKAGILGLEPKLTPFLSLLLVHDHLLSKRGIAAPTTHPLRQAVERHKARLQAEFTKARLRRRCASIEDLRVFVQQEKRAASGTATNWHPRWVRINTLLKSLDEQLGSTFAGYRHTASLSELQDASTTAKVLYIDDCIPNLIALQPEVEITKTPAYRSGELILQDKASCFPAQLLLSSPNDAPIGDIIDACAAPGNKTTHLAALLSGTSSSSSSRIFACERDPTRSKTLQKMIQMAHAESLVTVLPNTDFLALNPEDPRFANVTGLLLDPSCSGSGILGREDIPILSLPSPITVKNIPHPKKRKREQPTIPPALPSAETSTDTDSSALTARLTKLSNLQTHILTHAFSFPSALRITYSTCSVHVTENEAVVARALATPVAKERGWRVLGRDEEGVALRGWERRGEMGVEGLGEVEREGCLRCVAGDGMGTMGFFVVGFVRDGVVVGDGDGEEWNGFSDGG